MRHEASFELRTHKHGQHRSSFSRPGGQAPRICASLLYCLDVGVAVCKTGCWGEQGGSDGGIETISMIVTRHYHVLG